MESPRVLERLLENFGATVDTDLVCESAFADALSHISSEPLDVSGLRLAFDCLRGNERATRELKGMLDAIAETTGRDLVRDDDLKAELCQQVYVLLLYGGVRRERGYLLTYGGRAPLRAWLRTVFVRHSVAAKRRGDREKPLDVAIEKLVAEDSITNPELTVIKRKYADKFRLAFRGSVAALPARDRLILRHHLVDRLTAEQIGRRFGVHRVTVARWMRGIRLALLEQTRIHLGKMLRTETDELETIFGLVESQIFVSFSGLKSNGSRGMQPSARRA